MEKFDVLNKYGELTGLTADKGTELERVITSKGRSCCSKDCSNK